MIKFFRQIRFQLMGQNKTGKYLKYAIGEIVLVVIGILIALQINNFNQNQLDKVEEQNYYKNIKRQLNEDKNVLSSTIDYNNQFLEQFTYAINIIEKNDRSMVDSLARISINLLEFSDFHRQNNIYEAMVNSGEIKLLKNHQIIEKLQRLEEKYILINKLEDTHSKAALEFIVPSLISTLNVYNMSVENIELLYSYKHQNLFTLFVNLMNQKNEVYKNTSDQISSLNDLIDEELDLNG